MPNPTEPYYTALASLKRWAEILGAAKSAIAVNNIPEPALPDWEAERAERDRIRDNPL